MLNRSKLIFLLLKNGFDPNAIAVRLELRKALADCDSVLDVGCGCSMNLRWLQVKHSIGVEGHKPTFERALKQNTHDQLVCADVRELDKRFQDRQFDACIAMDVIEHLSKEDGYRLIDQMERLACRKIIFFTPNGFLPQQSFDNNNLQEHLSGWEVSEMEKRGYQVFGLLGPKNLRGERHVLKGSPKIFWGIISFLCHIFWIRAHPAKAAAIFCVKTKV